MKNLQETIKKLEPIKVYIKEQKDDNWTNLGIYKYSEIKKRYEGDIGYLTIENITKWILGSKDLEHLKIEVGDSNE